MTQESVLPSTSSRELKTQERVSLLQQVKEGLQADQRVYFAGEILRSERDNFWLEMVDIIVAPVNPIYDPEKLNQFMDSLVPDIPRSARDEASKYDKKSDFSLGRLYFDEILGETTREILITTTAIEPEALKRAGVPIGESRKTERKSLARRTWVRVYPDASSAQIIAEYERGLEDGTAERNSTFDYMKYWFSAEQLKKLRRFGEKLPIRRPRFLGGR